MIQVFKQNFAETDIRFIEEINSRFPKKDIVFNFNMFLMLDADKRVDRAIQKRRELPRTGWGLRGIPAADVETVDEHTMDMKALATLEIPTCKHLPRVLDIIESHDTGEVIVGDFTPHDSKKISKAEKHRIERLAIDVIYAAQPEMVECWLDFEEERNFAGKYAGDIDKAQMFKRSKTYMVTHPKVDLSEFVTYCHANKWKTDEGRNAFQRLACN